MTQIQDIFEFSYGNKLDKNKMSLTSDKNIAFIGRSAKNNGIVAYVESIDNIKPYSPGLITVALGGSILSSFVQPLSFYTSQNVAVLTPKDPTMSLSERLFYCYAIQFNAQKYGAFGREANRTLKFLEVPSPDEIPEWVYTTEIPSFDDIGEPKTQDKVELPPINQWKDFKYPDIFILKRGTGGKASDADKNPGSHPYIGASDQNNGITKYTSLDTTEPANSITVANNGSVGAAFYQPTPYLASSDITVLTLKNYNLTPAVAMFLITLIRQEGEKVNYGRKWGISRMKETIISLPVTSNGEPDWDLMERYINGLPYSKYL